MIGAPYSVTQYHKHVSLVDARGYAVAEIQFGTEGMPDVYRALEVAHQMVDRLNSAQTVGEK